MTTSRHRALARLAARFGKLSRLAVVSSTATVAVVAVGVAAAPSGGTVQAGSTEIDTTIASGSTDLAQLTESREQRVSRTAPRIALQPKAVDHKFATAPLNVWTAPREEVKRLGLLKWGTRIAVTGQVVGHWAEVLLPQGKSQEVRWVNADYLANTKPKPEKVTTSSSGSSTSSTGTTTSGLSSAPCPDGSSIESGITSAAVRVYRAVCAAFPEPTTYGGYDAHGEHADGRAIDIMISGSVGQQIADWLRANAAALGIRDIIFAQHIWTPERSAEGWRYMSSRGSATADHYDHVHVAVY